MRCRKLEDNDLDMVMVGQQQAVQITVISQAFLKWQRRSLLRTSESTAQPHTALCRSTVTAHAVRVAAWARKRMIMP